MKTLPLLGILLIMSTLVFAQSEKCTKYTKDIITAANLDFAVRTPTYTKANFKVKGSYAENDIMNVCDSIMKSKPVGWIVNGDKNREKEYVVDGKKLVITIYWRDDYLYFSY
jgi:poly-beta-hydroxyalkanoate depolymerase